MPGAGFFVISRFEDCAEAARRHDVFSNDFTSVIAPKPEVAEIFAKGRMEQGVKTLLTNDPPSHTRYRALVDKVFSPGRVKKMEGYITRIVHELIDGFIDDGEVELMSRFTIPLPLSIIADELGVPREDMPKFREWSDASVVPFSSMTTLEEEKAAARSLLEFQDYFAEKFAEKQANPTDDIISDLATTRFEDENRSLNVSEFLSICQQILTAGNETTANTIASAMYHLIDNPDQMAIARSDVDKHARNIGEETLRYDAPVQGQWRVVKKDTELHGVKIPAGSVVNLRYGSANRDERQFDHAEKFDITRNNARSHMAFGQSIHFCVGANLARKEIELAFKGLLPRMKNIRFAPGRNDFTHVPSLTLRGFKHLYLEFEKA